MSRRSRRGGGGGGHGDGGSERWLLTYADMITLLLALFILLFAMSTIDPARFDTVKQVLSEEFHGSVMEGNSSTLDGAPAPLSAAEATRMRDHQQRVASAREASRQDHQSLKKTQQKVQESVAAAKLPRSVQTTVTQRGVVISLKGDAFFQSGSDQLNPAAVPALQRIARSLARDGHNISIEGHTDGAPIGSSRFPDNWFLSTARANSVRMVLMGGGIAPGRIQVVGYADTRPRVKPDSPRASVAANRRVEIVVLAHETDAETGFDGQAANAEWVEGPLWSSSEPDLLDDDFIGTSRGDL